MVLEGDFIATQKQVDIREVISDSDWQTYRELQDLDQAEYRERLGRPAVPPDGEYLSYVRAKSPPAHTWLAFEQGQARAYCSSWSGENGVGQVEDLFTLPDFRHRGLATALIAHCVSNVRMLGAGPVVIIADPSDTPMAMYAAMGFRPLFVARSQYR
jgi:GNAT superfamily N-acetyltransferase